MVQELINHLNSALSAIQSLNLQPTEHNCSQICTAIKEIRDAAQIGVQMAKARAEPGEEAVTEVTEVKETDSDGTD